MGQYMNKGSKIKPYYSDDLITLYNADCLEFTGWLTADVLVTDPPYGVEWTKGIISGERAVRVASQKRKQMQGGDIANDHDTAARDTVLQLWGNDKPAIVFGSWRKDRPINTRHRLIWHKLGRFAGVSPHAWFPNEEEIYLLGGGWVGKPHPTVISTDEARAAHSRRIGHPTPKPIGLMELLITKCAPGVIVDPFAGSGATLLAARNCKRKSIGVEISREYCDLIVNQLKHQILL
jgi:site-specific DNA-methyltransferase (adenine-specific)